MNKRGFMITEQLFIVLTFATLLSLSPIIGKSTCEIKIKHFLNTLQNDLNYAMHYSLTNYSIVKVDFYPNKNEYKINAYTHQKILKVNKYDDGLTMNSYIIRNSIDITHGIVIDSHYFYLSCGNIKYKVNVYERSGILNATKQ